MTTELLVPKKTAIKMTVSKLETTYKMSTGLQIKFTTTVTTSNLTNEVTRTSMVTISSNN